MLFKMPIKYLFHIMPFWHWKNIIPKVVNFLYVKITCFIFFKLYSHSI
ncbi:hypothetical protein F0726_02424 [Acidithiobacillus caldus]|nr:hypothetical protein F0726_02424 [Acidithiobacillus caldus]